MILRPAVGMQQLTAVPHVVALGVCDALPQARIAWPHGVVDEAGEPLRAVEAHAGYDDEGMFVRVEAPEALGQPGVREAVEKRVASWADGLAGKPRLAPLAPVLADYVDKLALFGEPVRVCYPNGALHARGEFVGVDVWGRATVRLANDTTLEFPPEQFRMDR